MMFTQVTVGAGQAIDTPGRVRSFVRAIDAADFAARILTGGLFLALSVRIGQNFLETSRVTGLLLLASEFLVVVLTVVRRPAVTLDRRWHTRAIVTLSLLGPLLVRPVVNGALLADAVTATISGIGLLVVIVSKIALGRSFGLLPANRGIVCVGPYRVVRHPIYLGYFVTDAGFVLAHLTSWNLLVLFTAAAAQLIRVRYEEDTLCRDAAYAAYRARIRWRILPYVF